MKVYKERHAKGWRFLHKHPWDAESWDDPIVQEVVSLPDVFLVRGGDAGCLTNCRRLAG